MIKINCCCKICKTPSIYNFDEEMFCQSCFMKHMLKSVYVNEEIKKIQKEIDKLNNKKSSKWYTFKIYTYFVLLTCPLLIYVNVRYGLMVELICCASSIIMLCAYPLSHLLADKQFLVLILIYLFSLHQIEYLFE